MAKRKQEIADNFQEEEQLDLKAHVNEVLKQVGDEQGLEEELCLDEGNHCMLLFDEKIVLNMDLDEKRKLLIVYAYIGDVFPDAREEVYRKALEANFFWKETKDNTLGLDKQSQSMVLMRAFELPLTDVIAFEDCLGVFVEVVEKWMSRLERFVKEYEARMKRMK